MPLPWILGALGVAAVTAVVNAITGDDDSSSSRNDSGDEERREQEREARLQRKREGLAAKAANLKKERLAEAHGLLALSAKTLAELTGEPTRPSASAFENALKAEFQAKSAYAKNMSAILGLAVHRQKDISQQERKEFLVNLEMLESLYGPIPFGSEEQRDLAELRAVGRRLDRLQNLKQQIEQ